MISVYLLPVFCEDDGSASHSIKSRSLPQHLLAIDDDNTLVGIADALAREIVDGVVGILVGGLHLVDAGGGVKEETVDAIRLRHRYGEISLVSLILEDGTIFSTIVEAHHVVLDCQLVVFAILVF